MGALSRARALPRAPLSPRAPAHPQARVEFDQTIQETEAAYMKILESSSTLLGVLKRESTALKKTAVSRAQ